MARVLLSFEEMCDLLERTDNEQYTTLMNDVMGRLAPAMSQIEICGMNGLNWLVNFIVASAYADGSVDEYEYRLTAEILKALGAKQEYIDGAHKMIDSMPDVEQFKKTIDLAVDRLGELSPELKNDIVLLCLLVCAVDGKITPSEKAYIGQLILN